MTSIGLAQPSSFDRISSCVQGAFRRSAGIAVVTDDPEDARNRRAFVQEMLSRNPGAFSSDLDVQCMMQHFPGRF